jgi:hypothetical protein
VKARAHLMIGVACLVAAQLLASGPLKGDRQRLAPVPDGAYEALEPGEFAGTLLLGGFRGVACDLLWIRADNAKDNGRFYESLALFRAISRIQPRFEQVWTYMAWDMAYNIGHEVEDEDAKWTWMLAGLEANARGCARNPQSERLLRHLAWMFNHRGDLFHDEVERATWAPLLQPLLDAVNAQLPPARRLPAIPSGSGLTNFRLAAILYRACAELADARGIAQSAFVPRMVPLGIESDGNLKRNRGQHLAALRIWLEALENWQEVKERYDRPRVGEGRESADEAERRRFGLESYERNEGELRRKAAGMARVLAPTPERGEAVASAIMERRFAQARQLLAEPGWPESARFGRIRWLDEQ